MQEHECEVFGRAQGGDAEGEELAEVFPGEG